MNRVPRLLLCVAASAALAASTLAVTGSPGTAAADAQTTASSRLAADASGTLTYRSSGGVFDFAGVPAGVKVDAPGVSSSTSVVDAAAAHLERYGAAFGSKQAGTTLTRLGSAATGTGDVVRYQQNVGGLPVMGGEFVVSLRPDRELDSILAKTTRATSVASAKVSQADATATAQEFFQGSAGKGAPATVESVGRWVVDPALIGASTVLPTRTAWRFELTRGAEERRMVLVDDQLGAVLMDVDLINEAKNRIVCDNNQVLHAPPSNNTPCNNASANLVRTEAGAPAALPEAETAFQLGGAVHDNYSAFQAGFDLTNLIGDDVGGGVKALAQTVRWCYTGSACPYANAFWNGEQMYYGTSYATADDVVGHEMTHGVTERVSGLFYWSQSGAMNESISDIMGEIIDHRNVQPVGEPVTWTMGEDLPIGAIRNVQNPPAFNDPDRTGSALYVKENCCGYPDSDGVHSNSGVGNKTFYLASQGGTFNGQTITGIDTGDATLTKSAKLWLLVDQSLSSGSDYADLGVVLDQQCQALIGAAVMTAANCTAVHQAGLATELHLTPVNNPQPSDATISCPAGTTPRVLLDSETGTPTTKFTAGTAWSRNGVPGWGEIAHSNPSAWSSYEATPSNSSSLTAAAPIALPAGQASYLFFHHWRLLQYTAASVFNDAGTVELNGADAAALPWVNGPAQTINGTSNPANGRLGFGGDSRGYIASRVDLSSLAGQNVTPRFTYNNNNSGQTFIGWYVDDIKVYTCDVAVPPKVVAGAPKIKGKARVGKKLTALPGTWGPAPVTLTYQWLRNGKPIAGATGVKYKLKNKDKGKKISVTVTGAKSGYTSASATSPQTKKVKKKKKSHHRVLVGARLE